MTSDYALQRRKHNSADAPAGIPPERAEARFAAVSKAREDKTPVLLFLSAHLHPFLLRRNEYHSLYSRECKLPCSYQLLSESYLPHMCFQPGGYPTFHASALNAGKYDPSARHLLLSRMQACCREPCLLLTEMNSLPSSHRSSAFEKLPHSCFFLRG